MEKKKAVKETWFWEGNRLLERLYASFILGSLVTIWMSGVFIIPVALVRLLVFRDLKLIYFLVVYYSYRFFYPAKESALVQKYWRAGAKYFNNQRVIFDGFDVKDVPPGSGHLFCFHPHGILTIGWALSNTDPVFDPCKIKWMVTEALMQLPLICDYLAWNACAMISKSYMTGRMAKKTNLAMLPGGFEEAALYTRGKYRVYIKKRTGWVKYALQYGYKVHPVFVFGEEWTYFAFNGMENLRLKMSQNKIPGVFFTSPLGLLPYWDQDLYMVVGAPIEFPTIEKPTEKDVEKWHAIYIDKLQALFDKNKKQYCTDPNAVLEIR